MKPKRAKRTDPDNGSVGKVKKRKPRKKRSKPLAFTHADLMKSMRTVKTITVREK